MSEASESNSHINKRIHFWPPFVQSVYGNVILEENTV